MEIAEDLRPRVAIGVDPFLVRSAVYRALRKDPRIDAVLMPAEPDVRLQARTIDADALIVSHRLHRSDAIVLIASPDGTLDVMSGGPWHRMAYEGIDELAELVADTIGRAAAIRRHPAWLSSHP